MNLSRMVSTLQCDALLSRFAFNFNLRRYNVAATATTATAAGSSSAPAAAATTAAASSSAAVHAAATVVGRCKLTLSNPEKAPMVSALEARM